MSLGRSITAKYARETLQLYAELIGVHEIVKKSYLRIINIATNNVFQAMEDKADYEEAEVATLIVSNKVYLDDIDYYQVKSLESANYGTLLPIMDRLEFNNLANYPDKQSSNYVYQEGDILYTYLGATNLASNVGFGTLTIRYIRIPTLVDSEDDIIDLKDSLFKVFLEEAKTILANMLPKDK